ncbi:MAG: hypothetical protein ACFFB5_24190 [Promethearchaeota archaeon]
MSSVSWGDAFRGAILWVVYSCVWWIIGGVILFVGFFFSLVMFVPFTGDGDYMITQAIFAVLLMLAFDIIGAAICCLGQAASMIKVTADTTARARALPPRRPMY